QLTSNHLKSSHLKSNHLRSNHLKSNRLKSNHLKSNRLKRNQSNRSKRRSHLKNPVVSVSASVAKSAPSAATVHWLQHCRRPQHLLCPLALSRLQILSL